MSEASPSDVTAAMRRYPPEDFVDDFSFLLEAARAHPKEAVSQQLEAHYTKRYGAGSYNSENCFRLVAAFNYFMRHVADFDTGRVAVVGESGSLIPHHLIYAFYRLFSVAPIATIEKDFHPSILIRMAEEQRDLNETNGNRE